MNGVSEQYSKMVGGQQGTKCPLKKELKEIQSMNSSTEIRF